ncbi:MAG: DUF1292 domain-containing protein [Clostridia bacterium]|nr:DUF1292 domain-containing protein [Clostridia bacterium]
MTEPFEEDEFFEDEWVDVYDVEGRKTSLRHLATVRIGAKTYMILGEQEDFEEKGRLMLVRKDQTVDGMTEYVVAQDEAEIERVMGHFVMHLLMDHLGELPDELAQELELMGLEEDVDTPCGCSHHPGEFCFCGIDAYLQ